MPKIILLGILVATLISFSATQGNPIIKGPVDSYPTVLSKETFLLECLLDTTADISSVTWSKTAYSTETKIIYEYDGNEGSIIPGAPSNSTWKYRVLESNEQEGNFTLEIADISLTDVGIYECRVESDGVNYTEEARVTVYGRPRITQTPEEILNNRVYAVECSVEVALASDDISYVYTAYPDFNNFKSSPKHNPISTTYIDLKGLMSLEPVVFYSNFTTRAIYEDQKEISCLVINTFTEFEYELTEEVNIWRNPVITKGPDNRYPRVSESQTILLECRVNETADASLVTWSKTFSGSTELIYVYSGSEGKIIPPSPSDSTWKYRVLESDERKGNFTLEIRNVSLSDVGTYECTVESNGRNYTEQGNVTVYGNAIIQQSPEFAVHGDWKYGFFCAVEIAMVSNSTEDTTLARPSSSLWHEYLDSGPLAVMFEGRNWTGLDHIGKEVPVYRVYVRVQIQKIEYDKTTRRLLGCRFSTLESQNITLTKYTDVGVPVTGARFDPTKTHFNPGDSVHCQGYGGITTRSTGTSYQWFNLREPTVLKVEGWRLTFNDSDIGESTWTCNAKNDINGIKYSESSSKTFTVGSEADALFASKPIIFLLTFAVLCIYIKDLP